MNITSNATDVEKMVRTISGQVAFAAARTINKTARDIVAVEKATINRVFENPTVTTQNAVVKLGTATKRKPETRVIVKDFLGKGAAPSQWLRAQVFGGGRRMKRNEKGFLYAGLNTGGKRYAIPSKYTKKNRYGNVTGRRYQAALDDVDQGSKKYFFAKRKNIDAIWERVGSGKKKKIRPFLVFVKDPHYKRRFKFFNVGMRAFEQRAAHHMNFFMGEALKSARWK